MSYLVGQGFSQRLACRVAGLSRSAYCRTRAAGGAKTLRDYAPVRQWMNDFAATHRRWGYKRAWARAKSEGIVVGRDTFRHLWRAEGLRVHPRKALKPRTAPRLQRLVEASAPGQVWTIDFQFDSDWKGRVFKVCNVIDEFTRQHLALRVKRRMGAADVIEMLDLAVLAHGAPQVLKADNGPNSSPEPWGAGPASMTRSKRSSHRASRGITGSWSPYTTACATNSSRTTCSRISTTRAP